MHGLDGKFEHFDELRVNFGYKCGVSQKNTPVVQLLQGTSDVPCELESPENQTQGSYFNERSSMFSCLNVAAISANYTLANTKICNGRIGEKILPNLDSPKSFRRVGSSPSLLRLFSLPPSSQRSISTLARSISECDRDVWNHISAPSRLETSSYLNAPDEKVDDFSTDDCKADYGTKILESMTVPTTTSLETSSFVNDPDVQLAGGAAGQDRVQVVCSEENMWLYCGIYDGFNGRDAADFLSGTLYQKISSDLDTLEFHMKQQEESAYASSLGNSIINIGGDDIVDYGDGEFPSESFRNGVLNCLTSALAEAESEYLAVVEQEMDDKPELVAVGSCVLAMLLHRKDLYILNLGDSRALLATRNDSNISRLQATLLTEIHALENKLELDKVLADHPCDTSSPIIGGRVKGKLKLTRAFGVGYLKKRKFNDALMGLLQVPDLWSPPYVYSHPFTMHRTISENDLFIVLGSDGLFEFFSNNEIVELVHQFIQANPSGDPARYLVEQVLLRAAKKAGLSTEELREIPIGDHRRKHHDDVTAIVVILGSEQRMSTASMFL